MMLMNLVDHSAVSGQPGEDVENCILLFAHLNSELLFLILSHVV